jgi:hypothetical protein
MNEFVLLFDLISAVGIIAVVYLLYRKFVGPSPSRNQLRETAYEEGFSDAVKYFGLKKLYEEDKTLRRHMEAAFGEAGISNKITALLSKKE